MVDDCSADGTAGVARALGARVVAGREPPQGWVGKPWALQQGLEAARGEVVVSLDADTRPRPGLVGALDGALRDADFVTAGARFVCDGAGRAPAASRRCSPRSSTASGRPTPMRRRPARSA